MRTLLLAAGMVASGTHGGDVHLAKPAGGADPMRWEGLALGEVVDATQLERIVVLRAVTSAPRERDLANLRRMLADGAGARLRAGGGKSAPWRVREGVWHALLLMRSGQVFELEVVTDGDGLSGCLAAEDGASGCFSVPPPS